MERTTQNDSQQIEPSQQADKIIKPSQTIDMNIPLLQNQIQSYLNCLTTNQPLPHNFQLIPTLSTIQQHYKKKKQYTQLITIYSQYYEQLNKLIQSPQDVTYFLQRLSFYYIKVKLFQKAIDVLLKWGEIRDKKIKKISKKYTQPVYRLAQSYYFLGDYDRAILYFNQIVSLRPKTHQQALQFMQSYYLSTMRLVLIYTNKKDIQKAQNYWNNCLKQVQFPSVDSRRFIDHIHAIGKVYENKKQTDQAIVYFQKELQMREKYFKQKPIEYFTAVNHLKFTYLRQGNYAMAIDRFGACVKLIEQHVGVNHKYSKMFLKAMGSMYRVLKEEDKAKLCFDKAAQASKNSLFMKKKHCQNSTQC